MHSHLPLAAESQLQDMPVRPCRGVHATMQGSAWPCSFVLSTASLLQRHLTGDQTAHEQASWPAV